MYMRKTISALLLQVACWLVPMTAMADGYDLLWKKVETEKNKDLPRSQIEALKVIISKAEAEKAYGHLLKAEIDKAALTVSIAPDSLQAVTDRLTAKAEAALNDNYAVYAIYNTVLGSVYRGRYDATGEYDMLSKSFFAKALAHPERLASYKATDYVPLVVKGADSRFFNNDLLSLIGYEAEDYKAMHDYYDMAGNRVAAMFTALEMLRQNKYANGGYISYDASLDSLINVYSDLTECGEVAIERYLNTLEHSSLERQRIEYIDMALGKWGTWQNMNRLRNERTRLTNPSFNARMDSEVIRPGATGKISVSAKNISSVTMTISRLNLGGDTKLSPGNSKDYAKIKNAIVSGSTRKQTLLFKDNPEYETVQDSMLISGLSAGVYLFEFTTSNKAIATKRRLLHVTDMYVVSQQLPDNNIRFAVLNATTGQPVPGAMLYIKQDRGGEQRLKCGDNGELLFNNAMRQGLTLRPYTANDNACPLVNSWNNFSYYELKNSNDVVNLYTDRGIYRPGQTVHVSAVVFNNSNGVNLKAVASKNITLTLRDANRKVVKESTVVTDDYGCASTDFVLPSAGLTGRFTITSNYGVYGTTSFSVEQYKRPTFVVEFDDVEQAYSNGDTLTLTGTAKSYAGVPVQGGKVKYNVSRHKSMLVWRYGGSAATVEIADGKAVTDADGRFSVRVPMVVNDEEFVTEPENGRQLRLSCYYNFTTQVDVTDGSGETHSAEKVLTLGTKPAILDCNMAGTLERDSIKAVTFNLRNASGTEIAGTVKYYIDNAASVFTANANEPVTLQWGGDGRIPSGKHKLVAVCEGDTLEHEFIVFSIDDKRPSYTTSNWFYTSSAQFNADGRPVYVQVGSSDKDVHVLYTVISGNRLLESGVMRISDSIDTRRFEYRDEYGDGILLTCTWVKNGKQYSYNTYIARPLPDKRLNLKWVTFRDKLTPGQSETWMLCVSKPDGTPADARLLATMYDSSLEQIVPFNWYFNTYMRQNRPYAQWNDMYFNSITASGSISYKPLTVKALDFNHLNYEPFMASMITNGIRIRGRQMLYAKEELSAPVVKEDSEVLMSPAVLSSQKTADFATGSMSKGMAADSMERYDEGVAEEEGNHTYSKVQVRENFNETAFFYPALSTDAHGNIGIRFTLPESVTTWRFMGLVHDKEMNNGIITAEAVARKEVMVQPNVPRFMRVGDKAVMSTRIFNTSENDVNGKIRIELINPENGNIVHSQSSKFDVKAGETVNVSFDVDFTTMSSPLYIYKVMAEGKNFSDGEQHYLLVLPDAEMVVNTLPFTMNEPGTMSFDISRLTSASGKKSDNKSECLSEAGGQNISDVKLTIEYTDNPAWLMMQALPYVGNADEQNAISLAAAYYANGIGSHIIEQSPQTKTIFRLWQAETGKETSMASALQKNEELKLMALDETPWVMDADNEADRKQALANFFDENILAYNQAKMLEAMRKLQNTDGSFSWWKNMQGSPCMTAEVMEFLTRLNLLTSVRSETSPILSRADKYLSNVVIKEVNDMKRREKEGKPVYVNGSHALQFLYINAISGKTLSAAEKAASDYLLKYLESQKLSQSLYAKALMAVVLAKNGNKAKAAEYVKSLKEYTVSSRELGRYYDTPRAGYSWCDYRIPAQVAAIEAIQLVTPQDEVFVNEMRQWLLQQKRTQAWDTPINSVNAIYAFMNGNSSVLDGRGQATVSVDGKKIELPAATAGPGYVKTSMPAGKTKDVTVTKTSEGTSWGALYVHGLKPLEEISDASSGLNVKREILVNEGTSFSDDSKSDSRQLKIGDRVKVRLTIRADRDYDFVQVIDKRAACMEPVGQLSGYANGYYVAPKDNSTCYYFDMMKKGIHVIETEYYIDRTGVYQTGTCTVQCAYSPEYTARTKSQTIKVNP